MDLAVVVDDWAYDEDDEAKNIRKIVGVDGRVKLQIRLRDGLIQWELDGRPDGACPHGRESILAHCCALVEEHQCRGELVPFALDEQGLLDDLESELIAYSRRRMVLLKVGDYAHALQDALHGLAIVEMVRRYAGEDVAVFQFERHRPRLIAARARAEALLKVEQQELDKAIYALNEGIRGVEEFLSEYGLDEDDRRSRELRALVDLRRSLRERYSIPITDDELLETLKTEQQLAIQQENFEMAARLRDKINLLLARLNNAG